MFWCKYSAIVLSAGGGLEERAVRVPILPNTEGRNPGAGGLPDVGHRCE